MKLGISANPMRKYHSVHSPNLSGFFLVRCGLRSISALFGGGSTLTFMGMVGGDDLASLAVSSIMGGRREERGVDISILGIPRGLSMTFGDMGMLVHRAAGGRGGWSPGGCGECAAGG